MESYNKFVIAYNQIIEFSSRFKKLETTTLKIGYLESSKELLSKRWENLESSYLTFQINLKDTKLKAELQDDVVEKVKRKFGECEMIFLELCGTHNEFLRVLQPSRSSNAHSENPNSSSETHFVKVPPVQIKDFAGDYESWPSFRDLFTSVYVNHQKLTNVEKLYHLRTKCKNDAAAIIEKFSLTDDNFILAWEALKNQFQNKRMLVNTQLKLLLNLSAAKSETPSAIKPLYQTVDDCLCALRNLNINTENWDCFLVYLVSQRLPKETLGLWEQGLASPTEIPSWKNLQEFLKSRYRTLEAISDTKPNISSKGTPPSNSVALKKSNFVNSFHVQPAASNCKVCHGNHPLRLCTQFLQKDVSTRQKLVKENRYCYNCFSLSHNISKCTSKTNCLECNQRHHTLLHNPNQYKPKARPQSVRNRSLNETPTTPSHSSSNNDIANTSSNVTNMGPSDSTINALFASTNKRILLATAIVKVSNGKCNETLRALIDPGSEATFIIENAANRLNLQFRPTSSRVLGMGSSETAVSHKICNFMLNSRVDKSISIPAEGFVLKKLTGILPSSKITTPILADLGDLILADPNFNKPGHIELVIGADLYPSIICEGMRKGTTGGPVAQESVFGWIVCGPCSSVPSIPPKIIASHYNAISLNQQIQKFWELEEISAEKSLSPEDLYCEKLFETTTHRSADGKYVVRLPFKPNFSSDLWLGRSRNIALAQFFQTERMLQRKPTLKTVYDNVVKEYQELGHMIAVDSNEKPTYTITSSDTSTQTVRYLNYYLPHHGVPKPDSQSTPWRVVFNASCPTTNGISLNDVLLAGPPLQKELTSIIHCWCLYPFVFSSDIEKMYRQIWVHSDDSAFQRFLYRHSTNDKIQDYQLLTVTFGVNCAPFLAIATLRKLAIDEEKHFSVASKILKNDFYVDDVLSGAYDILSAKSAQLELINLLKTAGFSLKKWSANHPELLENIPKCDRINDNFLSLNEDSTIKALGVYWNNTEDYFTFRLKTPDACNKLTKRKVFSNIAKLFDPAGWLAPIVIKAKILMQSIWIDKTDWDEEITPFRKQEYNELFSDLPFIEKIKIPRYVQYQPHYNVQFHGFSDASQKALAGVVYVRVEDEIGNVFVNLISSKSKVAPLKVLSIPRLELCGAVLAAKLMKSIINTFKIDKYEYFMWTDSTIVLSWLKEPPYHWKTFVGNRVSLILHNVSNIQWRHVSSGDNPADLASRGILPSQLLHNKLWWCGPHWLGSPPDKWPTISDDFIYKTDMEEKTVKCFSARCEITDPLLRFSSLPRALRVLSYVFRFLKHSHPENKFSFDYPSILISQNEINATKTKLIQISQNIYFNSDYQYLKEKKTIPSKSSLLSLNPFMDSNGILRVHGRLSYSHLPYNEKYPIIIPHSSPYAKLLISYLHLISLHGGNKLVLNLLRKEYWIPRAQIIIKSAIHKCKSCFLQRKQTQAQIMSALPPERVTLSQPFAFKSNVGIDYAGPLILKNKGRSNITFKAYICIFVCFPTKAVHLEATTDLSSETFLAAFDRFISRRGMCANIFSDNGTNFVGANRILKKELQNAILSATNEAASIYATRGIKWHFIPPGTPHYGGLWEAGVKSLKHHLRRVMGNTIFTFEELMTVLTKVEACLNSRPLTPMSDDPNDLSVLTPGHFLTGDAILAPPSEDLIDTNLNYLKRWHQLKSLQQTICHRWKKEYLSQLHQRPKWKGLKRNIQVGDMVVVKNEQLPPTEWRLGRVTATHPGQDGNVRIATIKTQGGEITRHIVKLSLLPFESEHIQ